MYGQYVLKMLCIQAYFLSYSKISGICEGFFDGMRFRNIFAILVIYYIDLIYIFRCFVSFPSSLCRSSVVQPVSFYIFAELFFVQFL